MTWALVAMAVGAGILIGYHVGFFDGVKAGRVVRNWIEDWDRAAEEVASKW